MLAIGVLLGAVLAAAVPLNQNVLRPRYFQQQVQLVQQAYKQSDHASAELHLSRLIAAFPTDMRLLLARGQIYLEHGLTLPAGKEQNQLWDKAREDITAVETAGTERLWACICQGNYFCCKGDWDKAREYYQKALEDDHCPAEVANNHGYLARQQSRFTEALGSLTRAIQQDADMQSAYHNRALAYFSQYWMLHNQQKDPQQEREALTSAATDIEQALKLEPASGELYKNAATIHATLSQFLLNANQPAASQQYANQAARELRRAVELGVAPGPVLGQPGFGHLRLQPPFPQLAALRPGPAEHVQAAFLHDHFLPQIWD
jgi:pentatricopeptide repeat protein